MRAVRRDLRPARSVAPALWLCGLAILATRLGGADTGSCTACDERLDCPPDGYDQRCRPSRERDAMCVVVRADRSQLIPFVSFLTNWHAIAREAEGRHIEIRMAITDVSPDEQQQGARMVLGAIQNVSALYSGLDLARPRVSVSQRRFDDRQTSAHRRSSFERKGYADRPCCRDDPECRGRGWAAMDRECHDDVGYGVTDLVVDELLAETGSDGSALCSYLMVTQADNLYSRHIMMYLEPEMAKQRDMIGTWFVQHHGGLEYGGAARGWGPGQWGLGVDLGAVVMRAATLRANPDLRFLSAPEQTDKNFECGTFCADGHMFHAMANLPGANLVVLTKVLYLHE